MNASYMLNTCKSNVACFPIYPRGGRRTAIAIVGVGPKIIVGVGACSLTQMIRKWAWDTASKVANGCVTRGNPQFTPNPE